MGKPETAKNREKAGKIMREDARKHAHKTGQNPDKMERQVVDIMRDSDRKREDTGKR